MDDGGAATYRGGRLRGLFVGIEAGSAPSGLQQASLTILLAGKAVQIVDLLVTAGMSDALLYGVMMPDACLVTTAMSRTESPVR